MESFYSNGKLLISAEYLVLNGAEALALPSKFGQSLSVESISEPLLTWQSYNNNNECWLEATFKDIHGTLQPEIENDLTLRLASILNAAKTLNPEFLKPELGLAIKTYLDFPTNWGLGTSSTLINNIASWANINPFTLLERTFGGSGYDIACASNNTPITYRLNGKSPIVKSVNFHPNFSDCIYFVHLNKKQNSRDGIAHFKANTSDHSEAIKAVNSITSELITCDNLDRFNGLVEAHEAIIANIIQLKPVKQLLFHDFTGSIKSLGAWGGDFVMVTSHEDPTSYFKDKGYHTILPYKDMIL
ncbi:GYDIA family GHMP kinase [Formosa haliotis]|uniref:GYDIA family GHMP kinase n=1 Tax=Formosa haliotis TaxID=1555194 RepID=UPI000825F147|nr:GYDIA family GHMP kinase [Formosa haliotis]